jgi:hypothetical protein
VKIAIRRRPIGATTKQSLLYATRTRTGATSATNSFADTWELEGSSASAFHSRAHSLTDRARAIDAGDAVGDAVAAAVVTEGLAAGLPPPQLEPESATSVATAMTFGTPRRIT